MCLNIIILELLIEHSLTRRDDYWTETTCINVRGDLESNALGTTNVGEIKDYQEILGSWFQLVWEGPW